MFVGKMFEGGNVCGGKRLWGMTWEVSDPTELWPLFESMSQDSIS